MDFITVSQYAQQHDLPERTVRNWCAAGKMQGAVLVGKTWSIPADAPLPRKGKVKTTPLLKRLREEKDGQIRGGIYHRTQIDLTYNSNHIEGSRLTHEQTRFIFETNTIGITDETVNVDDIVETTNHFRCIDLIIDRADEKLSESLANGIVPFIMTDDLKLFYYRGLREWGRINGYLTDTILTAQDNYKALIKY